MITAVRKWGNSLGLRLPLSIANQINIVDGSNINIIVKDNKIEISKIDNFLKLDDLLLQVNDANLHNEFDTSSPIGNEICQIKIIYPKEAILFG